MSAAETRTRVDQEAELFGWRREQFERIGYLTSDAVELAVSRVDHHQLAELIDAGCPHELARVILS